MLDQETYLVPKTRSYMVCLVQAVLIFLLPPSPSISSHCSLLYPRLYTARPAKIPHKTSIQITTASSSPIPIPRSQPLTGPIKVKNSAGMKIGHQTSAAVHPQGLSSAGVDSFGVEEKKEVPVNIMDGKGTARMNGTRSREEVVGGIGSEPEEVLSSGRIDNFVRRRVRPMASGRERISSRPRIDLGGRKARRRVRVWIASGLSLVLGPNG